VPYFIDVASKRVVVLPPGAAASDALLEIDTDTAVACELTHDQPVDEAQIAALVDGSVGDFWSASLRTPGSSSVVAERGRPAGRVDPRSPIRKRAFAVARAAEAIAWGLLVLSIVVGLLVAFHTSTDLTTGRQGHHSVTAGLVLAFGGAFQCLLVVMIAVYIQSRTEN
jgi:ABC-type Fe3+ transport system permease subunit